MSINTYLGGGFEDVSSLVIQSISGKTETIIGVVAI